MHASFSIGASDHIELLRSKLDTEFALLANDGIKIDCEQTPSGEVTFLGYNISDYGNSGYSEEETRVIFKHYIANVVSDVILNNWEKALLLDIIRQNYYYFSPEEQQMIYQIALNHLNHGEANENAFVDYLGRKSQILQKLLEYLNTNDRLIIDGFIRFRLKDYLQELAATAEKAVDDFMLEKEYKEFIKLLKYFVEIQEPRVEVVHVIQQPSGCFKLLDGNNKNISSDYLEGFLIESPDPEINFEDLLISALITIAPNQIILHWKDNKQSERVTSTIKSVFGDRVKFCEGCTSCLKGKFIGNKEKNQ